MKIIVHGENILAANSFIDNLKSKFSQNQIEQIEGSKATLADLNQVFITNSLFAEKKLIIIENLKIEKETLKLLKNLPSEHSLIVRQKNQLSFSQLSQFDKNWQIHNFKPDPLIFKFIDSLQPGNSSQAMQFYKKIISENIDFSFLFIMIVRHFRNLLLVKNNQISQLELADWQLTKLKRQSQSFSKLSLTSIYKWLYQLDYQIKKGKVTNPFFYFSFLIHKLTVR